ncbi:hypothetical protein SV7mr_10580 [Stieleria bergensis]|uniref:Uncharacterized protein n=1 Tax=Stieleria bergensis TaxID=2528025 RepID=A0A517SR03_9BACT|nr:hypothetical protein SV7mr_10580 [Planctomycetes bacterium SV_7m_r]
MQAPQSLHKSYVQRDPIQGVDPTGLVLECATGNSYFCKVGRAVHLISHQPSPEAETDFEP